MNGINFFDVIRLSDEEKHNLKLMFNSDWNYIKKYKHSEKYQKLEYSDLYEFFAKHKYHNESEKGY